MTDFKEISEHMNKLLTENKYTTGEERLAYSDGVLDMYNRVIELSKEKVVAE